MFDEFVGTPLENDDMKSFKQLVLTNFDIFDERYQSHKSMIEDIGLNTLPEGEKTYSAKQQHEFFLLNLINISILNSISKLQSLCLVCMQQIIVTHNFSF